ncbi:MAG: IS5 family transposase [Nanoarchaeota archaeon]|nr:IS5 family transposase [Nanoarchaeota archaeon]
MSFNQFILKEQYAKVRGLGDRLELMKKQIEWKPFRPILASVFRDNKETGGRPHTNEITVVRIMLLQEWYGLSDPELEFQINDRLSFRNFLDFPETVPDFSTIWKIRDRLKEAGKEEKIWNALQHQLNQKGYSIQKGVIQDACFIEADFGRKRYYNEKKAEKKGEKIEYTEKQQQHMDKDGTFSVKHGQVHFGYKNHIKIDVKHSLIREYEVSTASLHDGEVNLVECGDGKVYRDKGYFGKKLNCDGIKDMTMKRASRGHPLTQKEKDWNKAVSRVRASGERPFAVMKNVFNGARTKVKTLARVSIKEMFKCFGFNLYQLVTLRRRELAKAL